MVLVKRLLSRPPHRPTAERALQDSGWVVVAVTGDGEKAWVVVVVGDDDDVVVVVDDYDEMLRRKNIKLIKSCPPMCFCTLV